MSLNQIRKEWLNFFEKHNHLIVESQSLIPKNDNSLLWINSGVATLKKYFSGEDNPPSNRLVNSQRCIRTNDLENVGVTSRHHSFFEMLGNFSIGDYFRTKAIEMAFEFLTKVLEIDVNKLYFTVFENDNESYELWIKLGAIKNHIIRCDKSRNFWEIGQGPCGPCTEIYYDRGCEFDPDNIGEKLFFEDIENDRYIEIWNIVFSEYENDGKGNYTPLIRKNIDTGAGLERLACISQGVNTNYDIDIFVHVRNVIEQYSKYKYDNNLYFSKEKDNIKKLINKAFVVIIDHFKSSIFAICDGAIPSNKDRGYIIRKLLRTAFISMDILKLNKNIIPKIIDAIIETMIEYYPYLNNNRQKLYEIFDNEYDIHYDSLSKSIKQFIDLVNENEIDERKLFRLVDTYGFPLEIINSLEYYNDIKIINFIIESIAIKFEFKIHPIKELRLNFKLFNELFDEHRKISKSNLLSENAINKQNKNLIDLNVPSIFDYEITSIEGSEIVKLYDKDFNELTSINYEDGFIVLDKTCFYATSGGQLNDLGHINNFKIIDVIKAPNGQHVHKFEKGSFTLGEKVKGEIDKLRRINLTAHHSTEHLLHASLKKDIDDSIKQEGALKSPDKVTFDFHYHKKLSIDEIKKIESSIKRQILSENKTELFIVSLDEAQKMGALAYFENVYKKIKGKLRVIKLGDYSIEICGGTHVKNTKDIEDFQIIKLDSKGSGSWRIEAISTKKLINEFKQTTHKEALNQLLNLIKEYDDLKIMDDRFNQIKKMNLDSIHYIELKSILAEANSIVQIIKQKNLKELSDKESITIKNEMKLLDDNINIIQFKNLDRKILMNAITTLINEEQNKIYIVINNTNGSYQYFLATNELNAKNNNINFQECSKQINSILNGKGGGKPGFVQGNFNEQNIDKINLCLEQIKKGLLNEK